MGTGTPDALRHLVLTLIDTQQYKLQQQYSSSYKLIIVKLRGHCQYLQLSQ